ncbi:MAPEG family protein [Croceicoccus mobilis]|uniref:Membrane protein n=1 Tax=Croceicoccus mobilis TaxID=1703339 RepID=A0A917DYB4_9SPHN|nr:MAPEG family protein [Croceicoccus mobilis]GGD78284.1 membrane protein [Croceicoccus mobilis]
MPDTSILVPGAVLVVWTAVMLVWMLVDRMGTFRKHKINLAKVEPGSRGTDIAAISKDIKDWPAHNYAHLMEQPTIFYAALVFLALGGASGYDIGLAWAYVALRIAHSIYQAKVNVVSIRAMLFMASSVVMVLLAIRSLLSVLG